MVKLYKHVSTLTVLVGIVLIGGCGDDARQNATGTLDPEARHCEAVAQRLTREVGDITLLETKAWTQGDVRNVRVQFAYPVNNPENLTNGTVACGYAFPFEVRGNKDRYPQAQSVYYRARNLSTNELLLLNMGLRGTKPQLKLN